MTLINENVLNSIGLTSEQSRVYLTLLEFGTSTASKISHKTGIGRALTYKVLGQLIDLSLAEKKDSWGKVSFFTPTHPKKLKEITEERKKHLDESLSSLQSVFGTLSSSFNMLQGKPNVQFFEGIEGLQRVYEDILEIGEDILIISSPMHHGKQGLLQLIREQIKKQAEQKIKTKAITPHTNGTAETTTPILDDEINLITRREIPAEKLNIPSQIIVYGDKAAITNFRESIVTVLIESKYIRETFEKMFEYIWNHS